MIKVPFPLFMTLSQASYGLQSACMRDPLFDTGNSLHSITRRILRW